MFGITPAIAKTVGEQRSTPKGDILPGINKENFWVIDGPSSDRLEKLLEWGISILEATDNDFVDQFQSDSGKIEFRIACFIDSFIGAEIESELLGKCADMRVNIGFEFYGLQLQSA